MRSIRGSAPAEAPCCCAWPATDWRWIRHAGLDRAGVRTAAARPLDPARVAGRRAVRAGRHRRHGRGAAGGLRLPRPRALGGAAGRALHVFGGGHRCAVGRPPGTGRQVDGSGRLRRHHRLAGRHPGLPRRQPLRVRGGHRGLDRGADPGGRGPHGHALRLLPRERALGRDRAGRVAGRGHLGAVVALVSLGLPLFSTSPRVAVATLWLDAALLFSWSEPRRRRARLLAGRAARVPARRGRGAAGGLSLLGTRARAGQRAPLLLGGATALLLLGFWHARQSQAYTYVARALLRGGALALFATRGLDAAGWFLLACARHLSASRWHTGAGGDLADGHSRAGQAGRVVVGGQVSHQGGHAVGRLEAGQGLLQQRGLAGARAGDEAHHPYAGGVEALAQRARQQVVLAQDAFAASTIRGCIVPDLQRRQLQLASLRPAPRRTAGPAAGAAPPPAPRPASPASRWPSRPAIAMESSCTVSAPRRRPASLRSGRRPRPAPCRPSPAWPRRRPGGAGRTP